MAAAWSRTTDVGAAPSFILTIRPSAMRSAAMLHEQASDKTITARALRVTRISLNSVAPDYRRAPLAVK
jgi:hypothetical protein